MENIEIPNSCNEWTYGLIESLVDRQCYETESFDFKLFLVNKRDPQHRERICSTATAFANSSGGFIIFGVADRNSSERGRDRLIGIDRTPEQAQLFGDQITLCQPSISYDFQNPPIMLPKDQSKVIFVVKIPQSLHLPHAVVQDHRFVFYKRTNQGNIPMTFAEIDKAFAIKAGVVGKLTLLHWQIVVILRFLKLMKDTTYDRKTKTLRYSLIGPDNTLLDVAICDLYPLIRDDAELLSILSRISVSSRVMRAIIDDLRMRTPWIGTEEALTEYHNSIHNKLPILEGDIGAVLKILEDRYGVKTNPIIEFELSSKIQTNITE
jgi:hypothetical protein